MPLIWEEKKKEGGIKGKGEGRLNLGDKRVKDYLNIDEKENKAAAYGARPKVRSPADYGGRTDTLMGAQPW